MYGFRWDGIGLWDDRQVGQCMGAAWEWCMSGGWLGGGQVGFMRLHEFKSIETICFHYVIS